MDNPTKLATVSKVVTDLTVTSTANTNNIALPDPVSNGKVALNVYQIYPKKLVYPLGGFTVITTVDQMIVGSFTYSNAVNANLFIIKDVSGIYLSIDSFNSMYIYIEYVDLIGDYKSTETSVTVQTVIIDVININKIVILSENRADKLSTYTLSGAGVYRNAIEDSICGTGIITVPNGYIGIISDIYFYSAVQGDFKMYVRDIKNNIKTIQTFKNMGLFQQRYNYMGSFNYPLYPGESVYFAGGAANMGNTQVHAIVTMTAV